MGKPTQCYIYPGKCVRKEIRSPRKIVHAKPHSFKNARKCVATDKITYISAIKSTNMLKMASNGSYDNIIQSCTIIQLAEHAAISQ